MEHIAHDDVGVIRKQRANHGWLMFLVGLCAVSGVVGFLTANYI
jgi:hypothetical protein